MLYAIGVFQCHGRGKCPMCRTWGPCPRRLVGNFCFLQFVLDVKSDKNTTSDIHHTYKHADIEPIVFLLDFTFPVFPCPAFRTQRTRFRIVVRICAWSKTTGFLHIVTAAATTDAARRHLKPANAREVESHECGKEITKSHLCKFYFELQRTSSLYERSMSTEC